MWSPIVRIPVERGEGQIYEHGWQSWSPSMTYRLGDRAHRPIAGSGAALGWRPEMTVPAHVYQGEGLLAVQPAVRAPVHLFGVTAARSAVPSIRAEVEGTDVVVSATGEVEHRVDAGAGGIDGALARWGDRFAAAAGMTGVRRAPTVWCSWYHYFTDVSEDDIRENLEAIDRLGLPVEVVQVDDGYQAEIGDWLEPSGRFRSVPQLVAGIRERGRRAGLWLAPFTVGARSRLAREHPDWLIGGADGPVSAGRNWDEELFGLDLTHPAAAAWLRGVFETMRDWGVDYFKIDFVYAGALEGQRHEPMGGVEAYRQGLRLVRDAIGDAYLLGCGAPVLPSVGLVDAMRVSPDTAPHWEPRLGDMSEPGARAAVATGVGRAWQQGRFWINDPDCLIVRPSVERREQWAAHVERYGGLRASSDRIGELDAWGLETTRRVLSTSPVEPFVPS